MLFSTSAEVTGQDSVSFYMIDRVLSLSQSSCLNSYSTILQYKSTTFSPTADTYSHNVPTIIKCIAYCFFHNLQNCVAKTLSELTFYLALGCFKDAVLCFCTQLALRQCRWKSLLKGTKTCQDLSLQGSNFQPSNYKFSNYSTMELKHVVVSLNQCKLLSIFIC